MSIKDYHRFLRSQMGYGSNGSAGAVTGAWLPALLLLVLGVLVSAAVALGWI